MIKNIGSLQGRACKFLPLGNDEKFYRVFAKHKILLQDELIIVFFTRLETKNRSLFKNI